MHMTMHLTIAIATWNRADRLALTLDALRVVELPDGVTCDAVVCDNNSSDETHAVVEAQINTWHAEHGDRFPLRYLHESRQGKSHALNRMIRNTQGDWLLFIDDDVKVEAGWLKGYLAGMERHPKSPCFGGAIDPWLECEPNKRARFLLNGYGMAFGILPVDEDRPMTDSDTAWGANMGIRRDVLPPDPFDPERGMIAGIRIAGEDVGIVKYLLDDGHECWLLPDARVAHYVPKKQFTIRRLWSWHMGIGRTWIAGRGHPKPGRLGVPWWAWKEFCTRMFGMIIRWRPWPTRSYYDAAVASAQYLGYLRAPKQT